MDPRAARSDGCRQGAAAQEDLPVVAGVVGAVLLPLEGQEGEERQSEDR